jgi:primosomal protein N' (replication factor Y) (superfamily II helicase)
VSFTRTARSPSDAEAQADAAADGGGAGRGGPRRWVEVAVDAAGPAGGQTFTYHLGDAMAGLVAGEAVLVEYGRRRALGIVLSLVDEPPPRPTKPIVARVRSDGPLLGPLQLRLVEHISHHYLAPPAMVVRQMLPPGFLERVELYARAAAASVAQDELAERIVDAGAAGVPVSVLPQPQGRTALLRRLHRLAEAGAVELEWRVGPPRATQRLERRVRLTDEGGRVAKDLSDGRRPPGRPLGPRQVAALRELANAEQALPSARLAERHGGSTLPGLLRRGLIELEVVRVERRPLAQRPAAQRGTLPAEAALNAEQAAVISRLSRSIAERQHLGVLLEGQAASGKSAVYAALVRAALDAGRGALVLVPEIPLAMPLLDRLHHDMGTDVALLHSALSDGERVDEWQRIRSGEVRLVVGTRIALAAPLADPGVIVVDEEHDAAYKSDRTPRLQARDTALVLGRLAGAPVVLGSATPDVVSVGRARLGQLEHVRLSERVAGRPAPVDLIDLRNELAEGNRGLLSRALVDALAALDRSAGEQAILLINRRGSASVVLCRDCGYVQICPECQRPLVFHAATLALRCHHCGAGAPPARTCPACASVRIRYLGGGTQRVEREIRVRFPDYRILRLDRDVVTRKGAAERVVDQFVAHGADVLVGTALVAKGLDVPQVTLVGVVSADIALNLPDERAAERTYQLLAQAVGRAGRGERSGRALIQTYQPDHPALRAVAAGDATTFYENELESRRITGSPPFGELVKLTVALEDEAAAVAVAERLVADLRHRASTDGRPVQVLGPVPAYIARRGGRWRFHVVLRGEAPLDLLGGDPGPPWSVDVDPESLL